ncbi:hypothetical protein [Rheinheimera maricola]|uniref:Uncharacterized protein n=1 Tax=Rheinheimera maricola TaxID=2793282 RepID=A0ABS7XD19_9GAMM|nr:hypothetical protein [Rheinheimera maricola]MBZ9613426.1 hypothetical protein [Rheinheimera maricola]
MLIIDSSQEKVVEQHNFQSYIKRLEAFFYAHIEFSYFTSQISAQQFNQFIYDAIQIAQSQGFISEQDIFKYIVSTMILGSDFELSPEHKLLSNKYNEPEVPNYEKFVFTFHYIHTVQSTPESIVEWLLE